VVVVAAVAGIGTWLATRDSEPSQPGASSTTAAATTTPRPIVTIGPVVMTLAAIRTFSRETNQPIYWAGPRPNRLYELTETPEGHIFLRYLPRRAEAGTKQVHLTVATYPYPGALEALQGLSGLSKKLPGGGLAVVDTARPKNVHLAFPGVGYQIEVFDSNARTARSVAYSGRVTLLR
jgi:hypothetical protein